MTPDRHKDLSETLHSINGEKWRRIGLDRKAGVLVALWSLRSRKNCGIGEILDLKLLVDWCGFTHQRIIQLLPVNDTAYDAPPYCSTTAFGLNPVYLSLHDIPGIDPGEIENMRKEFEGQERVVYWKIKGEKMRLLWKAYEHARGRLESDPSFQSFCKDTAFWLETYAAFMVMKDKHEQTSWRTWEDAKEGSPEFVREICRRHALETGFYKFLQWHLDRQWQEVRAYANGRGVFIKGDIPYLLNNDAADVWALRDYFNLDWVAGCPPDFYVPEGQYWSFPTYRWDAHERGGFKWWIERLRHAEKYYDIFRIDHVLGFFRIWSIAAGSDPVYGQFVPTLRVTRDLLRKKEIGPEDEERLLRSRILLPAIDAPGEYVFKWEFHKDESFRTLPDPLKERVYWLESYFAENDEIQNDLWYEHGKKLLTLMSVNTKMLICAEDLGTVPGCVRPCLDELGIPKLLVDRWTKFSPTPKEKKLGRKEYWIDPWNYDPLSVSSPSNHDMPTLRGWWREIGQTEKGREERYENHCRFGWSGDPPYELNADGVRHILKRNLEGNSVFVILNLQDILDTNPAWHRRDPADDRINLPGTVSEKNWSWRMPVALEDLCANRTFNWKLGQLIAQSDRAKISDG